MPSIASCSVTRRAIVCLAAFAIVGLCFAATGPARAADKLTVLLDWFTNPDHGPLIIAEVNGYFADADLSVELVEPADPNDPPKLVAAGKAEVAISYQPQLHIQAAAGLPVARFGTLVATPLNALVALADGPVQTIADLKGRKVGYSIAGFEEALLGGMLATADLTLDDVELVNVNFNLTSALLSQQVDAVIGAFRNFELNQLALEGATGRAFYPEETGVPVYDELIFITRPELLDDPRLSRFLAAVERATLYIVNHPDDAWRQFAAYHEGLDDPLNERAWRDTVARFALRPAALDRGRYARFGAFLVERGVVDTLPPLDTYARTLQ